MSVKKSVNTQQKNHKQQKYHQEAFAPRKEGQEEQ